MAKATMETKAVTIVTKTVTLVLSEQEAGTLSAILWRIGGHPSRSRRRYAEAIKEALFYAGFFLDEPKDIEEVNRAIYFLDEQ